MQCPICGDQPLQASLTQQGVEVDYCPQCQGVWLDQGEIFHFTKRPKELAEAFRHAQPVPSAAPRLSPKTGRPMQEMRFLNGKLVIEVCPDTGGIWFDEGEIERLVNADPKLLALQLDPTISPPDAAPAPEPAAISGATRLRAPNPTVPALLTVFWLYAPLVALLGALVFYGQLPRLTALIVGLTLIGVHWGFGPWLMDRLVRRVLPVRWIDAADLPEHLRALLERVGVTPGIALAEIGLMADSRPNAFTYGSPQRARMILTQGVLDLLDAEEQAVIIARELGQAARWDLRVMTVAYAVPWMLSLPAYQLLHAIKSVNGSAFGPSLLAIAAYWSYRVSAWPARGLSRARHLAADRFAGDLTGQPNRLIVACARIMHALTGIGFQQELRIAGTSQQCPLFESIGALGVVDGNMAKAFAVAAHNAGKTLRQSDRDDHDHLNLQGALKWELWNPWARYYEGQTLHPLFSRRVRYLTNQAETLGQEPVVRLSDQKPERYWSEFGTDLLVQSAPTAAFLVFVVIAVLTRHPELVGLGLIVTGILALVKFFFTYPTELFPLMTISSLFKNIKVSGIRPVSCTLKGKLSGDQMPGSACADSTVMRDYTGLAILEYPQPLRIWEFLFSAFRAPIGAADDLTVEGWYRRSPVPYIEIKTVSTPAGVQTCHAATVRKFMILLMILLGFVLAFAPLNFL